MEKILVVDDDAGFRGLLETILSGEGYSVVTAVTASTAIQAARSGHYHLVLTDLRLGDGDGLEVLRAFKEHSPETPVIMITAFASVASAVDAMKLGAADYLGKPLGSPEELRVLVRRTLDQSRVAAEREWLREEDRSRFGCQQLITADPGMQHVLELARRAAPTQATVLLMGESGTGKEIVARCIHENSTRTAHAFVPVNCAALSPALIESELFGHEKGAFTGAASQHLGRFERAHLGTLFLDEIGELDANLQTKLLRVLQEKTFERVGGIRSISSDVRVIAATNRNLHQMVDEGRFRVDLYYRLNLFPIEIPPLRDRPADIVPLARVFLSRAARQLGKPALRLAEDAERALCAYSWPGNVRELENLMERVAILSDSVVCEADLPLTPAAAPHPTRFKDIERKAIEDALRDTHGNRTHAARRLGISLRTLQYRLKEYGINAGYSTTATS